MDGLKMNLESYKKAMKIMSISDEISVVENALEVLSELQLTGFHDNKKVKVTIQELTELLHNLKQRND
jgi:hypothetical protein